MPQRERGQEIRDKDRKWGTREKGKEQERGRKGRGVSNSCPGVEQGLDREETDIASGQMAVYKCKRRSRHIRMS